MKRSILIISATAFIVTLASYSFESCRKKYELDHSLLLQQVIPDGFPQPVYRFEDNPLTTEGFELGRKLFYDGRLH